ncbi:alpha/beta fold hydrolase [Povalibacter sp.]|uniref:alpha/beta fold hydrolase n=1 Tax=Povalibacter sp. TaxID=1962978 RepID=UPI002F4156ED
MTSVSPDISDLHDEQIVGLLRTGAHGTLLSAYFGDVAYRELSHLARLAAIRRDERGQRVFILPGIMGSRLAEVDGANAGLVWLHPSAISQGLLSNLALPGSPTLRAVGIMLPGYLKLKLSLEVAGFTPVFHPFDWRRDLIELGLEFLQVIERSGARKVLVVAHSMGGLVARAALAHDTSNRIERLVQLGAPNNGSYAPLLALRAVYPTVRKIASLDQRHSAEELARDVFRTLPGLYELLPEGLFDADAWPRDELAPELALLAQARRSRSQLADADERCLLIAGTGHETVTAADVRDGQFDYTLRAAGDGTVPSSLALWRGARTWFVAENHGTLTQNNSVLAAVDELLRHGDTQRLSDQSPPAIDTERHILESELRRQATHKVRWDELSLDSRRRILDPVLTPEFCRVCNNTDIT